MRVQHFVSCAVISFVFGCGGQTTNDNASAEEQVGSEETTAEAGESADDEETAVDIDGRTPPDSSTPSAEPEPTDSETPIGVDIGNPLPEPESSEPEPVDPTTEPSTPGPSGTIEPDPPEPGPNPCSDVPACRLACAEGTVNPVDENGCVHSCECVPLCSTPEPEPAGAEALPAPGANPVVVPCVEPTPMEPDPAPSTDQEPEPVPTSMEPEPTDPCAEVSACDLACPEGEQHPVDANGCTLTCECEPADPLPICTMEGDWCLPDNSVSAALVAAPAPCCEGLSCQPQICDANTCPSSCQPVQDPCGGCDPGLVCIYQAGGPGPAHYTCAEETDPCNVDALCGCIQNQGPCSYDEQNQICQCDNGLE